MSHRYEIDTRVRERKKFYEKLRQQLGELDRSGDKSIEGSESVISQVSAEDVQIYGQVTEEEFLRVIEAYDSMQTNPETSNQSVSCQVKGGSYEKLLFSKQGFHNPGSSRHLVKDLRIKDIEPNTFLGGLSSYKVHNDLKIEVLHKFQLRCYLRNRVTQLYNIIHSNPVSREQEILEIIDEVGHFDPDSGDFYAARGFWAAYCEKKDKSQALAAINDLNRALKEKCSFSDRVKSDLATLNSKLGMQYYAAADYARAADHLSHALLHRPDNGTDLLHLDICQQRVREQRRPIGAPKSSFTTRRM